VAYLPYDEKPGIELLTGKVYGKVFDRHRSREFVEFLKSSDDIYLYNVKIKIIMDNHSSHIKRNESLFKNSIEKISYIILNRILYTIRAFY